MAVYCPVRGEKVVYLVCQECEDKKCREIAVRHKEEKKVEETKTETTAPAPSPAEKAKEAEAAVPAAPAPAPEVKAEEVKTKEVKAAKNFTGVIVKWKFAKTPDTALALLDAPNGKNQAFVTGKTPEIQKELTDVADSGTAVEVAGDYIAGKIPPVFEVSAVTKK